MKLKVNRLDIWTSTIEDRAGGAARKLAPLAEAGANFEFVMARRTPEHPGEGVLFVAPVKGAKAARAAQAAGFSKPADIHPVRIEGADKAGSMAAIARATPSIAGSVVLAFALLWRRRTSHTEDAASHPRLLQRILGAGSLAAWLAVIVLAVASAAYGQEKRYGQLMAWREQLDAEADEGGSGA